MLHPPKTPYNKRTLEERFPVLIFQPLRIVDVTRYLKARFRKVPQKNNCLKQVSKTTESEINLRIVSFSLKVKVVSITFALLKAGLSIHFTRFLVRRIAENLHKTFLLFNIFSLGLHTNFTSIKHACFTDFHQITHRLMHLTSQITLLQQG